MVLLIYYSAVVVDSITVTNYLYISVGTCAEDEMHNIKSREIINGLNIRGTTESEDNKNV